MTKSESPREAALAVQNYVFACGLLAAAALAMLPAHVSDKIRASWHTGLRPGLTIAGMARNWTGDNLGWLAQAKQQAESAQGMADELALLREQRAELQARVALLSGRLHAVQDASQRQGSLLRDELVPARLLGLQSQHLLQQHGLLSLQASQGVAPGDYVVESAECVVDVGGRVGVAPGMLVAAGMQVRGKLLEVGHQTSTFLPVRAARYRDVVRLGTMHEGELRLVAKGILEGTGEPLCQIKMVDLTAPVAPGDFVFTSLEDAPGEQALWYGNVVDVRQTPGQPHWEIAMQPATDNGFTPLAVVRRSLDDTSSGDDRLANSGFSN